MLVAKPKYFSMTKLRRSCIHSHKPSECEQLTTVVNFACTVDQTTVYSSFIYDIAPSPSARQPSRPETLAGLPRIMLDAPNRHGIVETA